MLDKDGNIDSQKLQKELILSLEADISYRQKDNAKKKAAKDSVNYDEFRAKVSCSHMKTLSRSEIETLKDVKKGWTTKKVSNLSEGPSLIDSASLSSISSMTSCTSKKLSKKKVKSSSDLEKDLRKITTAEEKLAYLREVTLKHFTSLIEFSHSIELFEEVVSLLTSTANIAVGTRNVSPQLDVEILQQSSQLHTCTDATSNPSIQINTSSTGGPDCNYNPSTDGETWSLEDKYAWVQAMSTLSCSDLLIRFLPGVLKNQISKFLFSAKDNFRVDSSDEIDKIITLYL